MRQSNNSFGVHDRNRNLTFKGEISIVIVKKYVNKARKIENMEICKCALTKNESFPN